MLWTQATKQNERHIFLCSTSKQTNDLLSSSSINRFFTTSSSLSESSDPPLSSRCFGGFDRRPAKLNSLNVCKKNITWKILECLDQVLTGSGLSAFLRQFRLGIIVEFLFVWRVPVKRSLEAGSMVGGGVGSCSELPWCGLRRCGASFVR